MRSLLAPLVLLALSCRSPAQPKRTEAGAPLRPEPTEALVWGLHGDAVSTWRVGKGGRILEAVPDVRVATTSGEWRWTTRSVDVPTSPCDGAMHVAPGRGRLTYAAFVHDGEAQVLVDPGTARSEANEIESRVELIATLGSLAFVEVRTSHYACGAHGATEHAFLAWDLEARRPFDAVAALGDVSPLLARAEPLLEKDGPSSGEPLEVTEVFPVLRGDNVRFTVQVTGPACYACSDDLWSSYTRSVRFEVPPPPALAGRSRVPRPVADIARRYGGQAVRGWSIVPEQMQPDADRSKP